MTSQTPEISRFLGIVIVMFYRDYAPAHFHAVYGDYEMTVTIETGVVIGRFPRRALWHVLEWYELHKDDLLEVWELPKHEDLCRRSCYWSRPMDPRLIEANYVRDYILHLPFADGTEGDVDLRQELEGEVFQPLKDRAVFQPFTLSPELHTVVWLNGTDFAPEFLYKKVQFWHNKAPDCGKTRFFRNDPN